MQKLMVTLLLLISMATLKSQSKPIIAPADYVVLEETEDTLGLLAYTILNDSLEENRYLACRALIPRLVNVLKLPNSFHYQFNQLHSLSIQYPPDSSFRIFTWQLFVNRDEYRYYGAIQMNSEELELYPLIDRSFEIADQELERATLSSENWYGYVVYDLLPVETAEGSYYLLFGADSFEAYRRRKMVDVLSFGPDGKPIFGKPIFVEETGGQPGGLVRNRLVQQYSAASYATLKYDTQQEMIMQENLVTVPGPHGEGPVNMPDGSYIGYQLNKDGRWYAINKVYQHTYDEVPRTPTAAPEEPDRDILGRRRN